MGDTQSAQRDAKEDAVEDTDSGQAQDSEVSKVEDKLLQNNAQISGLHGKSDDPLAELNDHLEDEFIDDGSVCDTESALVSAREDVSDTFATVDDKEALLEDVEINDMTDSDPDADEPALNEKEDRMNEINKGFRKFFSNISLKLTVKQGTDEKQAEMVSDVAVLPNGEEVPCSLGDTCDVANKSTSETCENNADHHMAQDSADNESTTCPTVTDMTSEDTQENVEHKTTVATEVDQEAAEAILAQADTEGVTSEIEPEGSCPQNSAEEEVLSPIKVFFTTGIFSSLRKKKKPSEEKNETNEKESVHMDREEQGRTEEIGKDLAKDEICPSAERAVVEEKQKTKEGNEEVIRESAQTKNGHGIGENLVNTNDELLSSEEKVKFQSSPLQRLLSGANLKKVSTKQRGRKKSSDTTERVTCHLQSSVESAEATTEESPAVAPEEVKKLEESAWETLKRLLTPKKFQKSSTLSNEEVVVSSKPEEPMPSEGEEIADVGTEESRKRKDSIVSWDSLLCGSGNRRSRKSSNADEQKPRTEGDDNRPAIESRHDTDLDSSHEIDDNLASSPEQGGSPSDDEGSTWKSFKRLVTPKRKSRDGEETKEHTSDSEIIQDESSFSLKKFLPGRKKRRPFEKQEQVPSDKSEREEHSDEEDSDTPAVIPLSEFDIPETESQVKIQAVIESQTPEAKDHKGQEEVTGQTTEAIIMCDSTHALPKETKDTDTALENLTSATPASMEEVDDLTEFVSKLQQLSDIPEEGLIEESLATLASFADDAARDDTIADVIEFTSEAVTAPEPIDITVEDETEMVSAVSQLTDSSKTSGNTTPVPADYDVKETDNLLHQVVESISATQNESLVSASDQSPEQIAGSVSCHILETSISKELSILKPHQTSDGTLLCTEFTVEVFDAIDRIAEAEGLSDMTEAISTQCLSEDTTEEFHLAGISVDELKYINESQVVGHSSSDENKAKTSEVSPQAEDVNVAGISIDDYKNDNEQANEMAPPGTDSYVEVTIQTDNAALWQKNEALEDKYDQIKESRTDDEAQVQSDEMVDESETLTLTDACVSINSEEVSVAQADEMPAMSEATPTDEIAKGNHLLSGEQMQDVTELNVGDEEQHELLVVKVGVAEFEHVAVSAPGEPEDVIMKADKTSSQLQSCSSGDVEQAEQGVQELESQSMTEDIPVQDSTVPDRSITSTEAEEQMQHTPLETEMYIKEDAAEVLQDALYEGGDKTTEVTGELQKETSVEENVQVLEHKVITEDSPVLEDLTGKHLATGENEPMEVPQHISFEEDGQIVEMTNELKEVTSIHMTSVNHDVTIIQAVEKLVITEDNAESQAENALPSSTSEVEKEAAAVSEQGLAEKELICKVNDTREEPRQVIVQEDGQLTKVTDELETLTSLSVASVITEYIAESQAEEAKREVEKEAARLTEQGFTEKELVSIENDPCDEPREVLILEDGQLTEVTDELKTSQSIHLGTLNSEARNVEFHQKQFISEDIIGFNTENASTSITDADEEETATQSDHSLLEKEFVTVENDQREVPQQIPVENCGQIIEVTNELEESTSVEVASVNSDVSTFQSLEKQAFTEDNLESHAENAVPTSRGEVVKETAIVTEQGLVEKKVVSIENDCDVSQNILVHEDFQLTEGVKELETFNYINVTSVNSEVGIAQALEKLVLTEDNAESQAENALPSSTSDVYEQGVADKELDSRENYPCDVPRQVLIQESGKLTEMTETSQSVHLGTLNTEARDFEFYQKQIISEDIIGSNTENTSTSITDADEKETATESEQSLLAKELVTVESVLSEELQHISVTDYIQVADVTEELEPVTSTHEASVDSNAAIVEVPEKQVVSEDIPEQDGASASVTAEVENETGVLIEQALVEKPPTMVYDDPKEIPQQSVVKEDVEVVNVSTEFEALPAVQIAPLFSIVEVIEKQVTSQDLVSNAENAYPVITVEDEKATVTQPEQPVLEKELLTVESDLSEEPQQISVTDDVQVAEVTKALDPPTHINLASVDSNAGIVEVLENQVLSGDIPVPDGSSVSVTAEVENETGLLTEDALVVKELPTVDYDPNGIPQQSVVKEDDKVVKVSTEFEAPPTLHTAPLISESSIVEVIVQQVTFEDLGSNAENAKPVITVEEDKETVTQSEQCLLEKELVTVERDLIEEPQHISVTDVVQIADITKELEASTSTDVVSVDYNVGIVEVLEKQDISEDIQVSDVASASVTAEIENETGLLTEQALLVKKVPSLDADPNEIPQQSVVKDGEVVKVSTEFEAPSHVQITPLISDSSIVEVIEKQVTSEDLGSDAENANTLITVENEKRTHSEQSLLEKELVTVESNLNEEPQHISDTDVQVAEVTKEFEASTFVHVASLDSNAGIVEILEKQVVSENIPVSNGASVSVTAEVENETGVLIEQVVGGKALPAMDDDPNAIPQQRVVKQDDKVVKVSTEFEAPSHVQITPLILGSSMVEVIEKQVISEDIPVTDAEKASASTTAEAENETALLIAQALVEKVLITVVKDLDEIHRQCTVKNNDEFADIAKLCTPQVLQKHVIPEVIPAPDTENALDSMTVYIENQGVILTEHAVVEKEIQTIEGDPYEVPKYSAVKNNDQSTEVTKDLEAPTAVKMVLINQETSVTEVFEKQHDYVALVVPEPSHEVVSTAVNDEGDINKLAEVEKNAEMVEGGAAMQYEDGAAIQAFTCGAKYVKTSMHDDANTETPNIREPLLDVMATEEEPQDTVEPVRVLEPYMQEDMIEMAEKSKGDAEIKSAEEVGVTDANEAMDIGCKVQNEVENVSTSLATEEEILAEMDNVIAKEVDQQENQTEVSEEGAKEESCLKEERVCAVQVIVTPPTDKQEATEITQSEPSELEAQKVTENKSDASIERQPEVLSITEIGNEEETASIHVFATTDDFSIDKPKTYLDETKVELKKESDENVIDEDSSCSPELLAAKEMIEAKQEQTYSCYVVTPNNTGMVVPQIIISSEKVQPTIEMRVREIQAIENVESNIQMEVTELQVKEKEDPTIKIEVTELQVLEKVEPNIQKELTELGTEQKSEPLKQIQVSAVEVKANVVPKIQIEGTDFPATEKLESTIKMEGTELQVTEEVEQNIEIALTKIKVTERPEDVVQAIEAIDLEETEVEIKKEFDLHLIEDSSFSPQEVAATEMMDAKQEQTHPCEVVTPSEEGETTIKMEVTEIQLTEKVQPKIQMEVTELQVKRKVEPNIQIALTEMKNSSTQPEQPEVGVQVEEALEKARTIKMADVPESLQKRWVSEVSVTRVIEVTGLVKEFDSTREMIQAEPVVPQVGTEQVVFLSQTGLCHSVVGPLETTPQHLVHIEQAERAVPSSRPVQPEVGVEAAEPVPRGEEELGQDVWLDAEEDIGKQEGAEKTEIEPQESVESQWEGSQADDQEEEFLDTTGHAQIEEESSPEEIQAIGEIYEIEREGEDFAIAQEDSQIRNLTETSLICKELD